ncbi:MAG TPA: phytoene desaturase family protein, partial [Chitinophagaceae bacterium]|nr:phytoene desaturase family protein [Chitinophagaceae bacterium]
MATGKKVVVIGSGFAGLSAASFMAKAGWEVTVLEKNDQPGGRAGQLREKGFVFDTGPSFYWMPDVFERYFSRFGKNVRDYYSLQRLDPSYRVYWQDGFTDLPANYEELQKVFESIEAGSAAKLDEYLAGAAYKYRVGINNLVYKPGLSLFEFIDWETIRGIFKLEVFTSIRKHIHKYFKSSRLRQIMEFPVLFLGALPEDTPALYSLMNYADIRGGTWHPAGGMYSVVKAMHRLAEELGVEFRFGEEAEEIVLDKDRARQVRTKKNIFPADAVISGADYHFTETRLLPPAFRNYPPSYWDKKVMAPSCLLYYVGLNRRLKNATHHSLFFDVPFDLHGKEIYKSPQWPTDPLFYVNVPSVTDHSTAPEGGESMVFLVPVAAGLEGDTEELRERYFQKIAVRMEYHLGENFLDAIVYRKSYSVSNFLDDYNSFRGNA